MGNAFGPVRTNRKRMGVCVNPPPPTREVKVARRSKTAPLPSTTTDDMSKRRNSEQTPIVLHRSDFENGVVFPGSRRFSGARGSISGGASSSTAPFRETPRGRPPRGSQSVRGSVGRGSIASNTVTKPKRHTYTGGQGINRFALDPEAGLDLDDHSTVASCDHFHNQIPSAIPYKSKDRKSVTSDFVRSNRPIVNRYHRRDVTVDYDVKSKILGTGYTGPVKKAKHRSSREVFAVKTFNLKGKTKEKIKMLRNEVDIFLTLDHPHICRLVDVYEWGQQIHMVMECCHGGELYHRLLKSKSYAEEKARDTAKQMLFAINYLQHHNVAHRDLKLENFLYESDDENAPLKLIDFGFSKVVAPRHTLRASCGSLSYVSPDVLKGSYTPKCDMWSYGVIVYMLLSGHPPFASQKKDEKEMFNLITNADYDMPQCVWKDISADAKHFVNSLLVVDPKMRMSADNALRHPWMNLCPEQEGAYLSLQLRNLPEVTSALCSFGAASHFDRVALAMMAWHLGASERKRLSDIFLALDEKKCGTINLKILGKAITAILKDANIDKHSRNEVQETLEKIDSNNNMSLDYSEFLAAMLRQRIDLHEDLLKVAFDRFDSDKSGFIDVCDIQSVIGLDGLDNVVPDDIVKIADLTGRGKVNYDEFVEAIHHCNGPDRQQRLFEGANRVIDKGLNPLGGEFASIVLPTAQRRPSLQIIHCTTTTSSSSTGLNCLRENVDADNVSEPEHTNDTSIKEKSNKFLRRHSSPAIPLIQDLLL